MKLASVVAVSAVLSVAPSAFAQESTVPLPPAPSTEVAPTEAEPPVVEEAIPDPLVALTEALIPPPVAEPALEKTPEERATGLRVTGSYVTRFELREGYADLGKTSGRFSESDLVFYRARLGLTTTPIDVGNGRNVTLKFEPQASGFWADTPGTLADGALNMHQATLRISGDRYWVDAGRFEMAYGEHLLIGTVGWHQTGRSFDGIRTHITLDKGWVDVFATQVLENPLDIKPFGAGDMYFNGIYTGLGPMLGEGIDFDAYLLNKIMPRSTEDTELGMQMTVGSRFKKKLGTSADVRAEAGVQFGTGPLEQLAFQGDAEVGTKLGKSRVAAAGWFASGDDPTTTKNEAWDQLYPTAHKFMGLADIAGGRSNIMGGAARVRHKLDGLELGADASFFLRPETADGVDAYTGMEIDAWALKNLGKGLGLRGGYSIFVPNETGGFGTDELAHYVEVQLAFALK
ncbi:MAG: alginate export family protein [Myxococcales bacterium]|nr:alginate export family protein [Myxococcales bacterium]